MQKKMQGIETKIHFSIHIRRMTTSYFIQNTFYEQIAYHFSHKAPLYVQIIFILAALVHKPHPYVSHHFSISRSLYGTKYGIWKKAKSSFLRIENFRGIPYFIH